MAFDMQMKNSAVFLIKQYNMETQKLIRSFDREFESKEECSEYVNVLNMSDFEHVYTFHCKSVNIKLCK
jgi:hypothetical protein